MVKFIGEIRTVPELLAPAGNMKALEAAARHGADAVYFGVGSFNARANADNISADMLPDAIDQLHKWSAKAYLALNILLSDKEMPAALDIVNKAYSAGADAIIIQDIGLAAQINRYFPDLPMHASTQMTITDEAGLAAALELGFKRVILPRELNMDSIFRLSSYASNLKLETEIFVHGALCISYSGQCLMSSVRTGRSANRGMCSQPCRLNYQCRNLNSDQSGIPGDFISSQPQPLISPRDQALIDYLPRLAETDIKSVKIEGRMRSAEYTAVIVSQYRDVLDLIANQNTESAVSDKNKQEKLLLAYNRGGDFTDRYLNGNSSPKPFLTGSYPGSFGLELGRISDVSSKVGIMNIIISPERQRLPVRYDVLSVRRPGQSSEIASAPIGNIEIRGRLAAVKGFHPDALLKTRTGDSVFWMTDRNTADQLAKSPGYKTLIELQLSVEENMSDNVQTEASYEISLTARILNRNYSGLSENIKRRFDQSSAGLSLERAEGQLKKTGNTPFKVEKVIIRGCADHNIKVSVAQINQLRRDLLEHLLEKMVVRRKEIDFNDDQFTVLPEKTGRTLTQTDFGIADRDQIQVWYQRLPLDVNELACGADTYILPLWSLDQRNIGTYVKKLKENTNCRIFVWLPPAPQNEISDWVSSVVSNLAEFDIDGITGGHPGIRRLAGDKLAVQIDSTANITNAHSCCSYLDVQPESLALSSELNLTECLAIRNHNSLTGSWGKTNLTLQVYGRQRLMSSIFCPVGKNQSGCRKCHLPETSFNPDASRTYIFVDQKKENFPLQTHPRFCTMDLFDSSIFFNNEIFNSSLTYARPIAFRLDFYNENYLERISLVSALRKYLQEDDLSKFNDLKKIAAAAAARQFSELVSQRREIYE